MIKEWIAAVENISRMFEGTTIEWVLVGSLNQQLQGMNTDPHDVDIIVRFEDLEKIPRLFAAYAASQVRELEHSLSGRPAWEVSAIISGCEVQFLGADDADPFVKRLLEKAITMLQVGTVLVPCFTLEAEIGAYRETQREEKALRIQKFLLER